jgi:hypothetical protein
MGAAPEGIVNHDIELGGEARSIGGVIHHKEELSTK